VKLTKAGKHYEFQLSSREKDLLRHVLSLYPKIPAGYQRLSKGSSQEQNQQLLDDALAETRAKNRARLDSFLEHKHLKQEENGWHLRISREDMEWLLEVLNDVRVGSWLRMGSPEPPINNLAPEAAPDLWAMELAGYFQMAFLELLDG